MEYMWALLLALILMLYVVLDGFDLGIGLLTLFTRDASRRAAMMTSIGAVWDANETWLVVAGGVLFGAFTPVYAIVLNALYIPIMVMLFGLIFRAVSFEFRVWSSRKGLWETAFGVGSLAAVLGQGFTVGGVLSGIAVSGLQFAGGPWDWFNPLSVLTAVAVGFGYSMLGSSYLIYKVPADMVGKVQAQLAVSAGVMFLAVIASTILAPFVLPDILEVWLSPSGGYYLPAMGAGVVFAFVMLLLATRYRKYTNLPFFASLAIFILVIAGGLAAIQPYMIPPSITIEQAASSRETLIFMLIGIGLLIPVMLAYNIYMYWIFRGRIEEGGGYGEE